MNSLGQEVLVVSPRLLDFNEFKRNLPLKDIREICDSLALDGAMSAYLYSFTVNTAGNAVRPSFYNENNPLFNPLKRYLVETFNNYKWVPSYQKGFPERKEPAFMVLGIDLSPDKKKASIFIKRVTFEEEEYVYKFKVKKGKSPVTVRKQ